MTRICWWLVDLVSGMLDPDEREAVRGDFAELGESGGHALRDVLGLVFRRQAALWKDWRPWLVLVGLVGPSGVLLSLSCMGLQRSCDLYFWIFRNSRDIDPTILKDTGLTVHHGIVLLLGGSLLLGAWSWSSGFVLGLLSHRTILVNGALFCLLLLFGASWGTPLNRQYLYSVSGGMFPLVYYTVIFPIILHAVLILLPSLWGIYQSHRLGKLPMLALLLAAAVIGCGGSAAGQTSPQDYPQWRGRNRDGSASAFSKPGVWPEKLTRRWKVEVGEGYATPLIVGGTIYSFTRRNGSEVMMALNAADGHILWQTGYAAPYKMGDPAKAHGPGPKATPLYHNGKLYTLGISGIVSAFDAASGKLVWQKPAPAEHPFFGAASSPAGDKDLVIFHPGN